jgi:hypothetical protein
MMSSPSVPLKLSPSSIFMLLGITSAKLSQGRSKSFSWEAREGSRSGSVRSEYVGATRSSAARQ